MSLIKYPYTNLHELNLDWIIEQLNNQDGPVRSVNGKSGIVTLTGEDIVRSSSNPETVATALNTQGTSIQTVRNQIGVTALPTTAQTLTGAIAENAQEIADVEDNVIGSTALPTTAQTLTGAIAENAQEISNVEDNVIGNTALPTTAQTLTGAIAENAQEIANVEDNVIGNTALPTTAQTLTGAIAELKTNMDPSYSTVSLASGIVGTLYLMKMGKLRMLTGYVNPGQSTTGLVVATLGAGDQPPVEIKGSFSGYGVTQMGELSIKTNGNIEIAINGTPSNTVKLNIMWGVS